MIVEKVSPTPYALLQRAGTFDYEEVRGDVDPTLVRFGDCENSVEALTFESRRVLDAISSTNASAAPNHKTSFGDTGDSSWSRFEDIGFSSLLDGSQENGSAFRGFNSTDRMRTKPASGQNEFNRPTTPSWADFLSSGFHDDANKTGGTSLLSLPPQQILPPITPPRVQSSQSHVRGGMRADNLDPPELNATSHMELDETFWWVWMSSLAGEEPAERKAVFGRCAFVETEAKVTGGGWLILEEQVKGAAAPLKNDVKIVEKKSRFTFGRKSRQRRQSTGKKPPNSEALKAVSTPALSHAKPTADQEAKVHQAAANLVREQEAQEYANSEFSRRGRWDDDGGSKTNSIMTLGMQPVLQKEAGPAMQWARKFDKDTIRERYLGDPNMGIGSGRAQSMASLGTMDLISATKPAVDPSYASRDRELPPAPTADEKDTEAPPMSEHPAHSPTPPEMPQQPSLAQQNGRPVSPETPRVSESKHRHRSSEKSAVSPDDLNHTNRKPVGGGADRSNADKLKAEHPAFRKSIERKQVNGSTGHQTPAAAAATAAMKKSGANQQAPAETSKDIKSKTGSTRKFKNMFTRKKPDDSNEPEALAMHRAISSRNKPNTLRKPVPRSRHEDRPSPVPEQSEQYPPRESSTQSPPLQHPQPQHPPQGAPAMTENDFEGGPGPEMEDEVERDPYRDSVPESHKYNNSTAHFSNFTSGPLEDQPAFAGEDEDEYPEEHEEPETEEGQTEDSRQPFRTRAAERLYGNQEPEPTPANEKFITPMEPDANDEAEHGLANEAPPAPETAPPPPPSGPAPVPKDMSQDRWAQIRKNAAERRSDEHVHGSRASQSAATEKTDDGETSGEECKWSAPSFV